MLLRRCDVITSSEPLADAEAQHAAGRLQVCSGTPPVKTRLGETPLWVQFCVYSGTPQVKTRLGETPLWVQFCVYSGTLCKKTPLLNETPLWVQFCVYSGTLW